jgi:hypothetical protein
VNTHFCALDKTWWPAIVKALPLTLKEDIRGVCCINSDTDELIGAVVCEDWTASAVSCHIMVLHPAALRAGLIQEVANYVFTVCDRIKMYGSVPAHLEKAVKLNKHIGFTEIARLEDAYDVGTDYVLMELKRENCPYWEVPASAEAA